MRKPFNWLIFVGVVLIVGGVAIVWMVIWRNLPTSIDIVDATEKSDNSYPIIFPESAILGSDTLNSIPPVTPAVISGENTIQKKSSEDVFIPNTIPAVATTVFLDGNNAIADTSESSEMPDTKPLEVPDIYSGESYALANNPQSQQVGFIPDRLVIPIINLDAPIIPVRYKSTELDDQVYYQWLTPEKFAVGWHASSALLGEPGNTVLNGHHNAFGMVFKDLATLATGDAISVYSGSQEFLYQVVANMLLPERFESLSTRMENARWIESTSDERITLITCWPADSNTHRVIIIAQPVGTASFTSIP